MLHTCTCVWGHRLKHKEYSYRGHILKGKHLVFSSQQPSHASSSSAKSRTWKIPHFRSGNFVLILCKSWVGKHDCYVFFCAVTILVAPQLRIEPKKSPLSILEILCFNLMQVLNRQTWPLWVLLCSNHVLSRRQNLVPLLLFIWSLQSFHPFSQVVLQTFYTEGVLKQASHV